MNGMSDGHKNLGGGKKSIVLILRMNDQDDGDPVRKKKLADFRPLPIKVFVK